MRHEFPADGQYVFKITPVAEGNMGQTNNPFGRVRGEKLEVLIDGEVVKIYVENGEPVEFGQALFGIRLSRKA